MGFLKTPDECARMEAVLRDARFVSEQTLSVEFLSDSAWISEVLPPPLVPADVPRVTALVGRWQSNCSGDYNGGAIYLAARHGDVDGDYVLGMWMNSDRAILFGREVYGEPKKQAMGQIHRAGDDRMNAWLERNGVKLIQLDVALDAHHEPGPSIVTNFNVKARVAADGIGLQEDALLTLSTYACDRLTTYSEGRGALKLTGTVDDPLDEIPIREVTRGVYVEGNRRAKCRVLATIAAEQFLPYHYGRLDSVLSLDTEHSSRLLESSSQQVEATA